MNILTIFLTFSSIAVASAFVRQPSVSNPWNSAISVSSSRDIQQQEKKDIQCYIVNFHNLQEEGNEKPEVVCTSEPEEYAWFHGLDMEDLKAVTEDIIDDDAFEECVEGFSPRGIPEWECKVDENWQTKRP
eukprot:scaffold8800_cov107-Cylindrotheca_fusiformis.AAC.3